MVPSLLTSRLGEAASNKTAHTWLNLAAKYLEGAGVDNARLEVEWLMARALDRGRLDILLDRNCVPDAGQAAHFLRCVRRRAANEPLQYILGDASFCGLTLQTDARALIPRPETEQLAAMVWCEAQRLAALRPWVLDWGVGTGAIALAVAAQCPQARVIGVDRSASALELARENRARLGLEDQLRLVESDGFERLAPERRVDILVSNPPYIPRAALRGLAPEIREWEPSRALDGGHDGLDCYRVLAAQGRRRLRSNGRFYAEFGDGQGAALMALFRSHGWRQVETRDDLSGTARFLLAVA